MVGGFWERLTRGASWSWRSPRHASALPEDFENRVMDWRSGDRYHAKQGRSTARVRFDRAPGFSAYLKRHRALPWHSRLAALLSPNGRHSPGAAEWAHLERARALGVRVPEAVAAGERIGPWGRLESYLLVAELVGERELNEVVPAWRLELDARLFARIKREVIRELAATAARLHRAKTFHHDFYLCHVFIDPALTKPEGERLTMIDFHRLKRRPWFAAYGRWKDVGQLLYSTYAVDGIDDRDRLRFWMHYRRAMRFRFPRIERSIAHFRGERYRRKNDRKREGSA
jgi:heptose I phosphotransferase